MKKSYKAIEKRNGKWVKRPVWKLGAGDIAGIVIVLITVSYVIARCLIG